MRDPSRSRPCRCRARSAELAWHNHPINGVGRGYIETDPKVRAVRKPKP